MMFKKVDHDSCWSNLNRFDEPFNINKNRCEIPPILAGQHSPWALDAFLRWFFSWLRGPA
jgi:hypothetical protein